MPILKKWVIRFSFIVCLTLFLMGCVYQNRTRITQLSELNGKIYLATEDGNFKSYDIERNQFKKITAFKGYQITKIIPGNKSLILEARKIKEDKLETHEIIYFMTEQEELVNSINILFSGIKLFNSILISSDDSYVYALRNDFNRNTNDKTEFVLRSFRYDRQTKERIENHFNDDSNLVVRDIFDDDSYSWYACYRNPVATHWTTVEGNLIVVRKDKITSEQKLITLGNDAFKQGVYITGDGNNIWVFGKNSKENIFKISKKEFTYETVRMPLMTYQIKEIPSLKDNAYLWFLSSNLVKISRNRFEGKEFLNRFDKHDLKTIQIPLPEGVVNEGPAVADEKFIWIAQSQLKSFVPGFPVSYSPYLVRVSKTDSSIKVLPVETTFGEGISNIKRSFIGYMTWIYWAIVGGPG